MWAINQLIEDGGFTPAFFEGMDFESDKNKYYHPQYNIRFVHEHQCGRPSFVAKYERRWKRWNKGFPQTFYIRRHELEPPSSIRKRFPLYQAMDEYEALRRFIQQQQLQTNRCVAVLFSHIYPTALHLTDRILVLHVDQECRWDNCVPIYDHLFDNHWELVTQLLVPDTIHH